MGVFGTGRECRYPGARRGIDGIRGMWGIPGVLRAIKGASGCVGGVRDVLGLVESIGIQEPEGV